MDRRLIVGILVMALAWQGPAMAYSASLAKSMSTASGTVLCMGDLPNGNACDDCCSHGAGSCATACTLSLTAAIAASLSLVAVTTPRLPAPDGQRPALVEQH